MTIAAIIAKRVNGIRTSIVLVLGLVGVVPFSERKGLLAASMDAAVEMKSWS
jgi:hypothetical protein